MGVKTFLFGGLIAGATVVAPIVPIMPIAAASASTNVSAAYSCSIAGTTEAVTISVTGTATKTATTVNVKNVVFTVTNSFGITATISNIKVHVLDPNKTSAPFKAGSAHVAKTPAGWTAGHDSTGAFALFKGSTTIANGATVSNAALGAGYTNAGPTGTKISFKPAKVSFNVTSPITATVTCTPTKPVPVFASVTE
jgi:hypothetical protein